MNGTDLILFFLFLQIIYDKDFNFFLNFYCYSITVVCIFSPSLHPTPAKPTSLPHLQPPPWFCPCVLYSSSCDPLSSLSPPHSPLAIVRLFLTSMSLVIFCLLFSSVDYVPVTGEIKQCNVSLRGVGYSNHKSSGQGIFILIPHKENCGVWWHSSDTRVAKSRRNSLAYLPLEGNISPW